MRLNFKIVFITGGFTALLFHFYLVASYALKPNTYSFLYCYPYFHQNLNFFTPPPQTNYNLYASYVDKGKTIETIDVFAEVLGKHQNNRLSGAESLLLTLSNSIHYFETENNPGLASAKNFEILETLVSNYLKNTRGVKTVKPKVILVASDVNNGKQRVFYN